jgi:hypothetical protein
MTLLKRLLCDFCFREEEPNLVMVSQIKSTFKKNLDFLIFKNIKKSGINALPNNYYIKKSILDDFLFNRTKNID